MTQTAAPTPRRRENGYERLAPLFVASRALPASHPQRSRLRAELIKGYHPVARNIARKYRLRGESPDDLEQVATVGLILAVDRFEPERGINFLAAAVPTITGEVLRHLRDRSTSIRLPRRVRRVIGLIHGVTAELSQRLARAPNPAEIAEALDIGVDLVLEALAAEGTSYPVSLDEPARNGDGSGVPQRVTEALLEVEPRFALVEHRASLGSLLDALPERQRTIILMRFCGSLTQAEIGRRIGLSQAQVSRLLTHTLHTLRAQMTAA
jgi:RNA polymerase sigma-B factor